MVGHVNWQSYKTLGTSRPSWGGVGGCANLGPWPHTSHQVSHQWPGWFVSMNFVGFVSMKWFQSNQLCQQCQSFLPSHLLWWVFTVSTELWVFVMISFQLKRKIFRCWVFWSFWLMFCFDTRLGSFCQVYRASRQFTGLTGRIFWKLHK